VVALIKVYANHPAHSVQPAVSWFNPFDISSVSALNGGILLAVFLYWGWDSGVTVNEETEDSSTAPGRAAIISTFILVAIYLLVATAAQAFGGLGNLTSNQADVFAPLGKGVLGSGLDKLLIIAILTSASASTQTTILPTARTTLSMARWGALPGVLGRVHSRYLTPSVSTLGMGALSILWTVLLVALNPAQNLLGDSITAIGFSIAFYYGFTGFAAAWYFRRQLGRSVGVLVRVGLLPLLGGLIMLGIFVKAFHDYSRKGAGFSAPLLGIQVPIVIGIGALLLGLPLLALAALRLPAFFRRKSEVASPDLSL
jgi:amino acid transporter